MKKAVESSAPGKLMLFGEHAVIYGRPCIVTAVNQRLYVRITLSSANKIKIKAPSVGVVGYETEISRIGKRDDIPQGVRFIEAAVGNFIRLYKVSSGLEIETRSDFSSEFGFGSSSAVTVGTIASLSKLFNISLSKKNIFDLSYKTVLDVQGVGSGFDIAAAIWGGTIFFVAGGEIIEPVIVESLPIVIGYTGVKADTSTLIRQVANYKNKYPGKAENILNEISDIVNDAKVSIISKDVVSLGKLMYRNHIVLKKLGVSTRTLDDFVTASLEAGAYGAKLSGAGGGDCMIALVADENKHKVELAIKKNGGTIIKIKTAAEGVNIE